MFEPASVVRALGFLTRLPIPAHYFPDDEHRTVDDAGVYPLAGALIALPGAALLIVTSAFGAPALLAALFAVLATIALTGALHEDGLADTADGFGGGANPERRLAIMKDPAIGTYGVLAIGGSLLLRVIALAAIAEAAAPMTAALAFVATHAVARAAMVWHWSRLASAREDGVAGSAGQPGPDTLNMALIGGVLLYVLCAVVASGFVAGAVGALLLLGSAIGFAGLAERMIGGHTGDTIGASEQIAEASLLVGLAMAV